MRTVVLLSFIALGKLNASEYLNLMTRLRTLIETATPTALGLTDEEFEEFKALVAKLQNRVNYTSASALTAQLDGIDKQRDSLLTFLFSIVQNGVNLPLEAQRAAAEALALIIRPYANIQRLPGQQETVQVNGLLVDLAAEAAAAHVTTLNLTAVVEALKEQNDQYAALTQQRTLESDAKATENIAELRARMDPMYVAVTTIAHAESVANPTETTAEFIRALNATVAEVDHLYNLRVGHVKKEDQETVVPGTDDEQPGGEEPTDPGDGGDDSGTPGEI